MSTDKSTPTQQATTFAGTCWSVELPAGWSVEQDDICATLQRYEPVGALQISSAWKDAGAVTRRELAEFGSGRIPEGAKPSPVTCGDFNGFSAEYIKGAFFWKEWWLCKGQLLVYVTYNVDEKDQHVEIAEVERVLTTLKSVLP